MPTDLVDQIQDLKRQRKAVILVHNYCLGEVQDIGDYVGDSLGLSRQAAQTDAEVIVFCGVHFMAETAAILSPEKTVLLPDANAGCPMANMINARQLRQFRDEHPGGVVVTYVNSSAAVKAESDLCCTSANAVDVVASVPADKPVLFVPDRNLGDWVSRCLNRKLVLWNGFCPTHERVLPEHVTLARQQHPGAVLVVHPECRPEVVAMADYVGSTTGILRYCRESDAGEFLIATELGILHRLRLESPQKVFHLASPVTDCPNMKLTTLEKVLWCLQDMQPRVTVPEDVAERARRPIERMLEVSRSSGA